MQVLGHTFVNHKSEEMICWQCGFVLGGQNQNKSDILKELSWDGFHTQDCPKRWHGWDYKKVRKTATE